MPGLITHYICGEAVLKSLPPDKSELLTANRPLYNIGTQGPDIFFYNLPGLLRKKTAFLGSKMHHHNFRQFVEALLDGLHNCGQTERAALTAYICGYITHYAMDCNAHPYIYYKSGFIREGEKGSRLRYSVRHRSFETSIDVLMLKLMRSEKPADKKLWQLIRVSRGEAAYVAEHLGAAIRSVYNTPISGSSVYRAMACTVYTTRLLQSNKGRRKRFIGFVEDMTVGERLISSLIHMQEIDGGIDYLNIQNSSWHMPWDNSREYRDSFTDLFSKSVSDSIRMIDSFLGYIRGSMSKWDFLEELGNNSFATGIDAERAVKFLYHECVYD